MWQPPPTILILGTFLLAQTFAMNIRVSNATSLSAYREEDCFPRKLFQRESLLIDDCLLAIKQLPQTEFDGPFHSGAPDDPLKLPLERTRRTCTIDIDLEGSSTDTFPGGWAAIALQAQSLAFGCAYEVRPTSPPRWCRGGAARMGLRSRIIVSLRFAEGNGVEGMWHLLKRDNG